VDESQPRLEVHDLLALHAEAEVAGLDDPRVHRAHRDLEDAGALHAAEREGLPGIDEVAAGHRVPAERVIALGPELMQREPSQFGMARGREPEEIVDLPLEPARRERARGERGEMRRVRRHRDQHHDKAPRRRGGEDVRERVIAGLRPGVGPGHELEGEPELRETIGERGNLPPGKPAAHRAVGAQGHLTGARRDQVIDEDPG
jgi:hypothetical protein